MSTKKKIGLQFFAEPGDPPPAEPPKQDPPPKSPEEMLKDLMRNSVPKEEFDKLQTQYTEFLAKVASGQFTGGEEKGQEPTEDEKQQAFYRAIDKINNHKFKGSVEFMENATIINDYLVEHGERSAFAPSRGDITPEIESRCENFSEALKDAFFLSDPEAQERYENLEKSEAAQKKRLL